MFSITFGHWATISLEFANKDCGEVSFEERNLKCWSFSLFKKKIPTFSATACELGCLNCLQPIQMKILRNFSWKYFFLLSLLEHDGKSFGLCGEKINVGKFFQLFSQSLSAGVAELKTICPFEQFETSED